MRATMQATVEPPMDLIFRGLGLCDGCAAPLAEGEQLAGLCARCNPSPRPSVETSAVRRSRKEACRD